MAEDEDDEGPQFVACEAEGCGKKADPGKYMCVDHWYMMPVALRREIYGKFNGGNIKPGYHKAAQRGIAHVRDIMERERLEKLKRDADRLERGYDSGRHSGHIRVDPLYEAGYQAQD